MHSTVNHDRFIKLLATCHLLQTHLGKEERHIFYVASVITFSAFLELRFYATLYLYVTSYIGSILNGFSQFDNFLCSFTATPG